MRLFDLPCKSSGFANAAEFVHPTGNRTLERPRLHQLIREPRSITDRTFEITFLAPGDEAYCFTFD